LGQRVYSTMFENITIAAVQDVIALKAGAVNGIELHEIDLSAGGVTAPAEIRLRLKRLPATVTLGSGGSAPSANPIDSGDTRASTATARANDTTQATTSGTPVLLAAWQWNVLTPWQYLPAPEDRETIQAGEALVFDIPGAPASTTVSGTVKWRELP
jgi:hypothetical protein